MLFLKSKLLGYVHYILLLNLKRAASFWCFYKLHLVHYCFLDLFLICGPRRFFVICKKYTSTCGYHSSSTNAIDIGITNLIIASVADVVVIVTASVVLLLQLPVSLLKLFGASFKIL